MLFRRFAGNDRARFARRIVTDGDHIIDGQILVLRELTPRFRAQRGGIVTKPVENIDRVRIDLPFRLTSRAVGAERPAANSI